MNIWQKILYIVGTIFTGFICVTGIVYLIGVVVFATKADWKGSLVCLAAGLGFLAMAKVNNKLKEKMVVMAGKTTK